MWFTDALKRLFKDFIIESQLNSFNEKIDDLFKIQYFEDISITIESKLTILSFMVKLYTNNNIKDIKEDDIIQDLKMAILVAEKIQEDKYLLFLKYGKNDELLKNMNLFKSKIISANTQDYMEALKYFMENIAGKEIQTGFIKDLEKEEVKNQDLEKEEVKNQDLKKEELNSIDGVFQAIKYTLEDIEWLTDQHKMEIHGYTQCLLKENCRLPESSEYTINTAKALLELLKCCKQGNMDINDKLGAFLTQSQNPGFSPSARVSGAAIGGFLVFGMLVASLMLMAVVTGGVSLIAAGLVGLFAGVLAAPCAANCAYSYYEPVFNTKNYGRNIHGLFFQNPNNTPADKMQLIYPPERHCFLAQK